MMMHPHQAWQNQLQSQQQQIANLAAIDIQLVNQTNILLTPRQQATPMEASRTQQEFGATVPPPHTSGSSGGAQAV